MSNKLITVATLDQFSQAERIKGLLESANIDSYILDHGLTVEDALQLEKQVELQVREDDVPGALEIIGDVNNSERPDPKTFNMVRLIKKIMVPVDFTASSLNAACYAAHVAHQKNAEITIIHVYFNPVTNPVSYDHFYSFPANVSETFNEIIDHAAELMKEFMAKLQNYLQEHELSDIHFKTKLIGGIVEEVVPEFTESGNFDLIILGIRQKDTIENWFGSFMTEIINKSIVPVLAIPGKATYRESMYKRIMYATNFDKSDSLAINELIKIAMPLETHISVVHIDETSSNPFINYDLAHFAAKDAENIEKVKMDFDLIVNKNKARGIENYIIDHQIDILSVNSHKRNIITSLFNPSLAKELLFRLEIPMLIFHAKTTS